MLSRRQVLTTTTAAAAVAAVGIPATAEATLTPTPVQLALARFNPTWEEMLRTDTAREAAETLSEDRCADLCAEQRELEGRLGWPSSLTREPGYVPAPEEEEIAMARRHRDIHREIRARSPEWVDAEEAAEAATDRCCEAFREVVSAEAETVDDLRLKADALAKFYWGSSQVPEQDACALLQDVLRVVPAQA